MPTYPWSVTVRDAEGYTGTIKGYVSQATVAGAVSAATSMASEAAGLSNGAIVGYGGVLSVGHTPDVYGAPVDYLSVTFRAELRFLTLTGAQTVIGIPAPSRSIFMADGQTVDESNTGVATFISNILTNGGSTRTGEDLSGSLRGKLVKRAFRRKETIWSFAADLATPDE